MQNGHTEWLALRTDGRLRRRSEKPFKWQNGKLSVHNMRL
jgi:hypothetical protein